MTVRHLGCKHRAEEAGELELAPSAPSAAALLVEIAGAIAIAPATTLTATSAATAVAATTTKAAAASTKAAAASTKAAAASTKAAAASTKAAAATAAGESAAASARPLLTRSCLVDAQRAAVHLRAVEALNGVARLVVVGHLHEPESA
jgi:hypothetical protein